MCMKIIHKKMEKCVPGSKGGEDAGRNRAQCDDKRATTMNEVARKSSSSITQAENLRMLDVYQEMGFDIILPQNARCSGQFTLFNLNMCSFLKR